MDLDSVPELYVLKDDHVIEHFYQIPSLAIQDAKQR